MAFRFQETKVDVSYYYINAYLKRQFPSRYLTTDASMQFQANINKYKYKTLEHVDTAFRSFCLVSIYYMYDK